MKAAKYILVAAILSFAIPAMGMAGHTGECAGDRYKNKANSKDRVTHLAQNGFSKKFKRQRVRNSNTRRN